MGFTKLGLSDQILKGVSSAGYNVPTPIQALAIQPALEGKDIIGCAQTGTGKTAAFVLPMLHRLNAGANSHGRNQHPRGLVVTPTRELAHQVQDAFRTYGRHTSLRSVSIYGGVSMDPQLKALRRGVDVVVATPGRLLDHMQRGSVDLSHVEIVVLDEADRMLDMGFIHDMTRILQKLPASRQTLLFSATVSDEIATLARKFLRDPQTLTAGEKRNPVATVTQHFYSVRQEDKLALLSHAIEQEKMESVLVFSRTKHGADKIAKRLERQGVSSTALHSNRTQGQRQRALDGFKEGKYRVLVATDIAARGIDVDGISHVINYDIPQYAEDYIHRIGRTGRAGAAGDAMTFVGAADRQYLKRIESFTGKHYPLKSYTGFQPVAAAPKPAHDHPQPRQHGGPRSGRPVSNERPQPTTASNARWSNHPGQNRRNHGRPTPARPQKNDGFRKQGSWKKKGQKRPATATVAAGRKKKSAPKRFETFSSDGGSWSNY
jgi:ATP-dependent RNA helicase RhlE